MNPQAHTQTLPLAAPRRVLACGAFLKNRAYLLDGTLVHWSNQHGDLNEFSNRLALTASLDTLLPQASGPVQALAHERPAIHFRTTGMGTLQVSVRKI